MKKIEIEVPDLIKQFTEEISKEYKNKIEKIILFGSYARGEANKDSDIDILIIWKGKRSEGAKKIENIAYEYLLDQGLYFSIKVLSIDQYKRLKEKGSPFINNITKEGVNLV